MPYKCSVCDKNFSRDKDLKIHMESHSGEIILQCSHNYKKFSGSINLGQHMILHKHTKDHSGEKTFQCNICKESFANDDLLKIHFVISC